METYFNIRYEFDRSAVHSAIDTRLNKPGGDYICVADGVIVDTVNRVPEYKNVVNSGMFAICDSSYVPVYIRMIHGQTYDQYCGAEIFRDIVCGGRHRMIFLGAMKPVLESLRNNIAEWNPEVRGMKFIELPFREVDGFDYPAIADEINRDGADIIWVALGAPKQEYFMYRLKPYLNHGVMIAVGAVFKFYSNLSEKRAPQWMVRSHTEFLFRITQEPRKQISRCAGIVSSLPRLIFSEIRRKRN